MKSSFLITRDVIETIVNRLSGTCVFISNLGYRSRELYSTADGPDKFYMLGSMGLASSIGLGLSAVLENREVIVFDGDASIIMNLGSLGSIANFACKNLHVFVLDNRSNASTGGQNSPTAMRTDLFKIAKAAGVDKVARVTDKRALMLVLNGKELPTVVIVRCTDSNIIPPVIPLSPIRIKKRFMEYLHHGE